MVTRKQLQSSINRPGTVATHVDRPETLIEEIDQFRSDATDNL